MQGYSAIDPSYDDNQSRLDSLVTLLNVAATDSLYIMKSVTVKGCASPEGYTTWNHTLSEKRARNVRAYILEKTSLTDSLVHVGPSDVGWELLSEMIAASDRPCATRPSILLRIPHLDIRRRTYCGWAQEPPVHVARRQGMAIYV